MTFSRHYHHCEQCRLGLYPRDAALALPEEGDVSDEMEKRIADFGVNDTFDSAAERWGVHYPSPISENVVRRVVDRIGRRCESAGLLEVQLAAKPRTARPAPMLVVATDGSMVCTREASWKESKVAVVARPQPAETRRPLDARYVAVVGGQEPFTSSLAAALEAERADEVTKVAWVADGAHENWTLATELCPLALQILDLPHAIQHSVACAKVLLGDESELLHSWQRRTNELLDDVSPDRFLAELMECLPETSGEDRRSLDNLIVYYRTNERRMRYAEFRRWASPSGRGSWRARIGMCCRSG